VPSSHVVLVVQNHHFRSHPSVLAFTVSLVLQLSDVCNVRWRQHRISNGVKSMYADVQLKNYNCNI